MDVIARTAMKSVLNITTNTFSLFREHQLLSQNPIMSFGQLFLEHLKQRSVREALIGMEIFTE